MADIIFGIARTALHEWHTLEGYHVGAPLHTEKATAFLNDSSIRILIAADVARILTQYNAVQLQELRDSDGIYWIYENFSDDLLERVRQARRAASSGHKP